MGKDRDNADKVDEWGVASKWRLQQVVYREDFDRFHHVESWSNSVQKTEQEC